MVSLENSQENFITETVDNSSSLREERKRTGRYIAAGTAIFLSLLGVYQALVRGTPEYAALFAPALIMFVYVLWILYASKHYRKNYLIDDPVLSEVVSTPATTPPPVALSPSPEKERKRPLLNRSYSIA